MKTEKDLSKIMDLSFLSEDEQFALQKVVQRDAALRKLEENRISLEVGSIRYHFSTEADSNFAIVQKNEEIQKLLSMILHFSRWCTVEDAQAAIDLQIDENFHSNIVGLVVKTLEKVACC